MAKILMVDDSQDTRDALARFLSASGHKVLCAANGREALSEVLNDLPDAVLLDLVMPEMDGPSFLEVVRSYLRLQSLPVVVLTAYTDGQLAEKAQSLKVKSILAKGRASSDEIRRALEEAIGRVAG